MILKPFAIGDYLVREATPDDSAILRTLVPMLYKEDSNVDFPAGNIERTVERFRKHPASGLVLVATKESAVVGYCILTTFWNNEENGPAVIVDELYVLQDHRRKGIATGILKKVLELRPFEAVCFFLAIMPTNTHARKLYESLGFKSYKYEMMTHL